MNDELPNNHQRKWSPQPSLNNQLYPRRRTSASASSKSQPRQRKSRLWLAIVLSAAITASVILIPSITSAWASAHAVKVKPSHASSAVTATNTAFPDLLPGFGKKQLAGGLNHPIVFVFAPNGDIYIGEQQGTILIYRNGAILATPLGTISTDGS